MRIDDRWVHLLAGLFIISVAILLALVILEWRTAPPGFPLIATETSSPTGIVAPTATPAPHNPFLPLILKIPTPTPTSTPTASPTPTITLTPTASPTPTPLTLSFCDLSTGAIPIPDIETITSTIQTGYAGVILDLDVSLDISHTYVGDLIVSLRREDALEIELMRRPGPAPDFCAGRDIRVTLDDEAPASINHACSPAPPAIGGNLRPRQPLSNFDGLELDAVWTLTIADVSSPDEGVLNRWCLIATIR